MSQKQVSLFSLPVLVAALGYFVDIYDLLLFNIVREPSLQELDWTSPIKQQYWLQARKLLTGK